MAASPTCATPLAEATPPQPPACVAASAVSSRRPPLPRPRGSGAPSSRPGGSRHRQRATVSADESDSGSVASPGGLRRTHALREFIGCVGEEFGSVVAAFQAQPFESLGFTTFKSLWISSRMSAMFHVEFWGSTPSDTHHAILQVSLELLLRAIKDVNCEDEDPILVVRVVGHLFALYCAFCVQVSQPKVKVGADPSAWQTLAQLSRILSRLPAIPALSHVAHEAVAVLRRLEHEEQAFLKCLGGLIVEFQLDTLQSQEQPGATDENTIVAAAVTLRNQDEASDMLARIQALSMHYNASLQSLLEGGRRAEEFVGSAAAKRASPGKAGLGPSKPVFLRQNRLRNRATINNGARIDAIAEGLWSDSRESESEAWLSRLERSIDPSKCLAPSDDASVADATARNPSGPMRFGDGAGSDVDAALLALEEELVREDHRQDCAIQKQQQCAIQSIPSPNLQNPLVASPSRQPVVYHSSFSQHAMSTASSDQESDGMDELEAELLSTVSPTAAATSGELPRGIVTSRPSTTRKTTESGRNVLLPSRRPESLLLINDGSDDIVELNEELEVESHPSRIISDSQRLIPQQTRPRAASLVSVGTESDGLNELELELSRDVGKSNPLVSPGNRATRARQRSGNPSIARSSNKLRFRNLGTPGPPEVSRPGFQTTDTQAPISRGYRGIVTRSSDVESEAELDLLQQELNASIALPKVSHSQQNTSKNSSKQRPQGHEQSASRRKKRTLEEAEVPPTQTHRRSRRLSVASSARTESDSELVALQMELLNEPVSRTTSQVTRPIEISSHNARGSHVTETSESDDELKQLEVELATKLGATSKQTSAGSLRKKKTTEISQLTERRMDRSTKPKKDIGLRSRANDKPRQSRKSRQPAIRKSAPMVVEPTGSTPAVSPANTKTRSYANAQTLSSRRSVASSYDSDGLDELERELRAAI